MLHKQPTNNVMKNISLIFFLLLVASSCQNRFVTKSYENRKFSHQTVAVVPIESIFTGKVPDSVTREEIRAIEDLESIRFQSLVHSRLVEQSGLRNRDIAIDILSPSIVLSRLKSAGITPRQASTMNAIELANILEVQVVARGNVTMNRF